MFVAAAELKIRSCFSKSRQAAAGHLNCGKNDHYPLKLLLQSQYLSHLQNWKSKLKDRNEKRLHSSHSKFDVKQYWIELAHKSAILIEKESHVQFRPALPFLIFPSLRSTKVKYCFLAEMVKKTLESHEYFAICSCKFKSSQRSVGRLIGGSLRNQLHGKWNVEAGGRSIVNMY